MIRLPINDSNEQRYNIVLGGQFVFLKLRWNKLQRTWMLTVRTRGETVIESRIINAAQPLVLNNTLEGNLYANPLRGNPYDPDRYAWGRTHELVYVTRFEEDVIKMIGKQAQLIQ